MKRLLRLLALVLAQTARAGNECDIEFAINERLAVPPMGSAASNSQIVSVVPYDSSGTGGGLRVCWADSSAKDVLGIDWQTPPAGVTCETADTVWAANERVDLPMDVLSANTEYWYRVQCDKPDPHPAGMVQWTNRPVYSFKTLPAAGADTDFSFTLLGDTHFFAEWANVGTVGGGCGAAEPHGVPGATQWRNYQLGIARIIKEKALFHVDLGDTYMTDTAQTATCGKSIFTDPPDGLPAQDYDGFLYNQVAGWPTRNDAGTVKRGIQTAAVDANVRVNADYHVFRTSKEFQPFLSRTPMVFAWGNHDNPRTTGFSNNIGSCERWNDDGQGSPVKREEHMGAAWRALTYNPNTYYPNLEADCDNPVPVGSCDNDGYYYTFRSGLAQFWVLNPFAEAGDGGTSTSLPFDLSGRFPELPGDWSLGQIQYQWFAATFAASTAKWKFIALHHLPGGHGGGAKDPGFSTACYFYGRGGGLATYDRWCDTDGDTVAGPVDDPGEGGKRCEIDNSTATGWSQAEDTRPAGWTAIYGACPSTVVCRPTPYARRTGPMAGHALYGQPAIHALILANQDAGGSTFFLQGHDHLTSMGCKVDATGCSEIWHILATQPTNSDDGGEIEPQWENQTLFGSYEDYNGDTIPDYRTEGAPYGTPTDKYAGTIRAAGTGIRGILKVNVSNEGVSFDHLVTDEFDFPALTGQTFLSLKVPSVALNETDFDGAAAADLESKQTVVPALVGQIDCDDVSAPLEGSQSCRWFTTINTTTAIADAAWADTTALRVMDFLWRPTSDIDANVQAGFAGFRDDVANVSQLQINYLNNQLFLVSDDQGTSAGPVTFTNNVTYKVRLSFLGTNDTAEVWIDACGTVTCDSKANGADQVAWGTGGTFHLTVDGPAVNAETDGYIFRASNTQDPVFFVDAVGVCDFNPGTSFKCGDNWE